MLFSAEFMAAVEAAIFGRPDLFFGACGIMFGGCLGRKAVAPKSAACTWCVCFNSNSNPQSTTSCVLQEAVG